MKRPRETAVFYSLHAAKRPGIIKSSKGNTAMFKNQSKYEPVVETDDGNTVSTKYAVYLKGFNYKTFKPTAGWEKITTVDTEDEAKQKCIDILPQDDEQDT